MLSAFSNAAPITVSFSGVFDQRIIDTDPESNPIFIYEDGFSPINFNGSFTFDSGIVSSSRNLSPSYFFTETVFGQPTFSFSEATETALDVLPSSSLPVDSSLSRMMYAKQSYEIPIGQSTLNRVSIRESKRLEFELDDGSIAVYSRGIDINFEIFSTNTTPLEAATPIDLQGFLNFLQADIDTQKERFFRAGASIALCESPLSCVYDRYDSYVGSIVLTGITTVPIPATAWLFGSALIGLIAVRKKINNSMES